MAENNRNWDNPSYQNQQDWDQNRNRYYENDDMRHDYDKTGYRDERERGGYGSTGYSNDSARGREMENQGGYGNDYGRYSGYSGDRDYNSRYGRQANYGRQRMNQGWQNTGQYNDPYNREGDWDRSNFGSNYGNNEWQRQDWGRANVNMGYGGYTGRDYNEGYGASFNDRRDRYGNRSHNMYGGDTSNYGNADQGSFDRSWWDRTKDEVSSWFGDDEAERRRRMESSNTSGGYRGRGPKDYNRSQDRIREDVCDRLTDDDRLDATNIQVEVKGTEVILTGQVDSRDQKRRAEDLVESISGVRNVENRIKINSRDDESWSDTPGGRQTTNERIRNTK